MKIQAPTAKIQAHVPSPAKLRGKTVDPNEAKQGDLQGLIHKKFGKESVFLMNQDRINLKIDVISSGSLALDKALGVGGLPRGRIIEIYGNESAGKTTLALHTCIQAQKAGGRVGYVDAEHSVDTEYARQLGLDIGTSLISQPDCGEQGLEIAEMMVQHGVDVVVVDSVAALTPRAEIEGEMGDSHMGLQARLMSQALRKLTSIVSRSHSLVIFINQLRMKIGVVYGNPSTTTGGNALKFYSTCRLEVSRGDKIMNGDVEIGFRMKIHTVKNKVAAPHRKTETEMIYGKGISLIGDVIDLGKEYGIIDASGAWMAYKGERIGQGRENVRKHLEANPNMLKEIETQVRSKIFEVATPVPPAPLDPGEPVDEDDDGGALRV